MGNGQISNVPRFVVFRSSLLNVEAGLLHWGLPSCVGTTP